MVYVASLIFAATLVLVIWQPRGLSVGWPAVAGAALALVFGVVDWQNLIAVTGLVWDATLTFVAIIVISTVLDALGFFQWAALTMAKAAHGDGTRAFLYVIILGALVSAIFSNDGAALILTPIVLEKMQLLKLDAKKMLPFVFAGGFIADTTSLPLVVSNLVNIVSADYFHLGFLDYVLHMAVPDLFSLGASLGILYLYFRRDIPRTYRPEDLPEPTSVIRDQGLFRNSWMVLGLLFMGYVLTQLVHIPVSLVAGAIAVVFLVLGARSGVIRTRTVLRDAPWHIVVFSLGMYIVVYGLQNVGLTATLGELVRWTTTFGAFGGILGTGLIAAVLSSIMNNLPTVMIGSLAIHAAGSTSVPTPLLAYANVIGSDLGPKMTPIGSLATLLWLHVLKKKGVAIGWGQYIRMGIVLTLPTLVVTLTGLYLWSRLVS